MMMATMPMTMATMSIKEIVAGSNHFRHHGAADRAADVG